MPCRLEIFNKFRQILNFLLKRRLLFLGGLLLCCANYFLAQQPSYFVFGQSEFEGVDIYDVVQDQDKNYIFATDNGLFLHDGYSFEKIDCDEMTSNAVFSFVKDKKGNIYCNNLNYQIFKITKGVCKLFAVAPLLSRKYDLTLAVNEQNQLIVASGDVFVYAENGKLLKHTTVAQNYLSDPFCLKDGSVISVISGSLQVIRFKNNRFTYHKIETNGTIAPSAIMGLHFFRLEDKVVAYDRKSKQLFYFNEERLSLEYKKTLPAELMDQYLRLYPIGDQLWVASSISGVYVLDKNLEFKFRGAKIFDDYFVSSIGKDLEGNFLVSTFDKGVLVIPNLEIADVIPQLSSYSLSRITSDGKGSIFLGTKNGEVLIYRDGGVSVLSGKGIKSIEYLYYWEEHDQLFFDNYGISAHDFKRNKTIPYSFGSLKKLAPVSPDRLYAGFNVGLMELRYNAESGELTRHAVPGYASRTSSVAYDRQRGLLYFTSADGLKVMRPGQRAEFLKLRGKKIFVADMKMSAGKLYMATREKGILLLEGKRIVRQLLPELGGRTVYVYKIQVLDGTIYANTSEGLLVFNKAGKIEQVLNKSLGIASNKIIDFHVDRDFLWIVHARGLQRIARRDLERRKPLPGLAIFPIFQGKKRAKSGQKIYLDYDKRKIGFELRVSTLADRENIRYHYKLWGSDLKTSVLPYEQNKVVYNALSPGSYRFEVQLESNGKLGPKQVIAFEVLSPFYLEWWFNLALILAGLGLLWYFFRRQLRIQQEKSRQVNELNLSKLTAIRSQMNPHFIFNSLNSIQDLVLKGDIDNSYAFITKFSNLVRKTLNYSDKEFISLEKEIQLIELYLTLEKLRFKDEFSFELYVPDELLDEELEIPPMLIQPFVENALVHGLLHREGEKKIRIRFDLEQTLVCTITDNGVGRERAKEIKERQQKGHDSFSVNASKKRFEILSRQYGEKLGFYYRDLSENGLGTGTEVRLLIPFRKKF